jgi:hypothetical protein
MQTKRRKKIMAKGKRRQFTEQYVQVPNQTAKAPEIKNNENPISLEALGLIVNLVSYADGWELHKTEIYKRFAFNKETSVKKAWNELIKAGYMVEYKYRVGKKWEYVYVYDIVPYTEEQRRIIWEEAIEEHGKVWGLDFPDLKMRTSKCGPQNQEIINTKSTQNKLNKNKTNKNNIKPIIDDDEKEPVKPNKTAFKYFVDQFEKNFPDKFDNRLYNSIWEQMHLQGLNRFTYKEAINQIKYMQGRIEEGKLNLGDYAAYFVGGILKKRTSQKSADQQEKLENMANDFKVRKNNKASAEKIESTPIYNWLEN